jgi:hypothetical protein
MRLIESFKALFALAAAVPTILYSLSSSTFFPLEVLAGVAYFF